MLFGSTIRAIGWVISGFALSLKPDAPNALGRYPPGLCDLSLSMLILLEIIEPA
jgi:hypothetical protein